MTLGGVQSRWNYSWPPPEFSCSADVFYHYIKNLKVNIQIINRKKENTKFLIFAVVWSIDLLTPWNATDKSFRCYCNIQGRRPPPGKHVHASLSLQKSRKVELQAEPVRGKGTRIGTTSRGENKRSSVSILKKFGDFLI